MIIKFIIPVFLFLLNPLAKASVIAVCETLNAGDPFLSKRIKRDYEQSANLAFADFSKYFPNSKHELLYCLDAKSPEEILSGQSLGDVKAIVGFTFTRGAKVASDIVNQRKILLITPTAALDGLFDGSYAMSRGISISRTGHLIAQLINDDRDIDKIEIYSPFDVAYSRILKKAITNDARKPILQHDYIQVDADTIPPPSPVHTHHAVTFTGYAFQHYKTFIKMARSGWRGKVYGSSQWAYNQDILRLILAEKNTIDLDVISDFIDIGRDLGAISVPESLDSVFSESAKRSKSFALDFERQYQRRPEAFSYAVYDAVFTALLISERSKNANFSSPALINMGWVPGVSGPAFIQHGVIVRPAYLMKWEKDRLVARKMFL